MVFLRRLGFLMVFSFIVVKGSAQSFSPKQTKLFKTVNDTIFLDSLSLVPGSIFFKVFPNDSSLRPAINYKNHALVFKSK